MKIDQAILTIVISFITAVIVSLVSPWIKWGIEKKKMRHERRIHIINDLKELASKQEFDREEFINSPSFVYLKNNLPPKTFKELERPLNEITIDIGSPSVNWEKREVLVEISKLEKKWKLV